MKKMDYKNLNEIVVHNQQEMDSIPEDFTGRIRIKEATECVYINKRYKLRVYIEEKTFAVARRDSLVEAWDNSSVVARDNSTVEAWDNSSVVAKDNSSVVAKDKSSVVAWDNSTVDARDNSSVVARDNSTVDAWDNSSVVTKDKSSVVAWDNSTVDARDNSSVVARGNVQVLDRTEDHQIKVSANARIVYMPKGLQEFINFYGIKVEDGVGTFYKAVKKNPDGTYHSGYNDIYEIGKVKEERNINKNPNEDCGKGIHISTLEFALDFGSVWNDLAILEITSKLEDIICPNNTTGKVRTSKVTILREVPLEECGAYGKMLAKRKQ